MASENEGEIPDPELRGMLLAVHLLGAGAAAFAVLEERRRESCNEAWEKLRALAAPSRDRTFAAWRAQATSAVPAGLARLHPSWLEEVLVGERVEVAAAARSDAGETGPIAVVVARELARLACARLWPLCEGPAGPLAEQLSALTFDELLTDLIRRGARTLGRSLAGATLAVRARAAAAAGEPWAEVVVAGSREQVPREARAAAASLAAAAVAAAGRSPCERLRAIGLAALKAELAEEAPGSLFRVAGRLPAPLGRALLGW